MLRLIRCLVLLSFILTLTMAKKDEEELEDDECKEEVELTTDKQKYLYSKWEEAWEDLDKNKTGDVIWDEYWAWVKGCLQKYGYSKFTIRKYKPRFYYQFHEIAHDNYGMTLEMIKCYISKIKED